MKEKYYLNETTLPTLPTPHDCIIREIEYKDEFLIFKFENDLNVYDSIRDINPNINSLVIKFHLCQPEVYTYKWKNKYFGESFELIDNKKIIKKHNRLEYLYQYVSHYQLIIELFSSVRLFMKIECDYIEYEWIEGD